MVVSKGVIFVFEIMEIEFMNIVEKVMEFVKFVDFFYFQIYLDCGNVINVILNYGINLFEDFSKGKGYILVVYLKEIVLGKFREIIFGIGYVNFEEIIKKLWEFGVRKFIVEFWYIGNDDWKDVIIDIKNFMDEKFRVVLG